MKKGSRRKYSREFKLEAVRMCEDRSVSEVARSLGVNANQLFRWRQALKEEGPDAFRGQGNRTSLEEENRQLKQENQQLRLEAEILKKCMVHPLKSMAQLRWRQMRTATALMYPASSEEEFQSSEP